MVTVVTGIRRRLKVVESYELRATSYECGGAIEKRGRYNSAFQSLFTTNIPIPILKCTLVVRYIRMRITKVLLL